MGANFIDALTGNNGNRGVQATNSQLRGRQMQAPTGNPLIDAVQGHDKATLQQTGLLKEAGKNGSNMQEFMIADKEYRARTGKPLTVQMFNDMYHDKEQETPTGSRQETYNRFMKMGMDGMSVEDMEKTGAFEQEADKYGSIDNSDIRSGLKNRVNEELAIASDQKNIDKENAGITKQNKKIESENLKAQKEYERKVQKDPIGGFLNYAKEIGLEIPTEFVGDKAEQRKQNYDLHNAQIEYFMANKMYDKARKAENEWIQNEINIDKSWGDKGDGNYKSAWNTSGPAKEKMVDFSYQGEYEEGGNLDQARNDRVPESVYNQGPAAIAKYMNERNKKQGASAMLTNVYVADKIKGQTGITPASEKVNSDRMNQRWAVANQTAEGTKYIMDAGIVRMKKSDGTEQVIKDKNVITKLKNAGII
jgi:hypothetical protein